MENVDKDIGSSDVNNDIDSLDDIDVIREKYKSIDSKYKETEGKNRQLFERTKKLENELREIKEVGDKSKKSDEDILKRLDKVLLRSAQITHEDDIGLFEKWQERTKMDSESILSDDIFQAQVEKQRTARKNQEATADIKGDGSGSDKTKDDPDYWIAKATTNDEGKLMFPEDLPKSIKLRAAIAAKLMDKSKTGKMFYNE